jgi:hypothetical protein
MPPMAADVTANDIPEFDLNVDHAGRVSFAHPAQARVYLRQFAGQCIVGQFYEHRTKRSDRQNKAFHACITPWAKARGWEVDTLKQFLLKKAFGTLEFTDPETGEVIAVLAEPHTSKLSVSQFVHLIDETLRLGAEDGQFLLIGDEYTKAKRAAERQAARLERAS